MASSDEPLNDKGRQQPDQRGGLRGAVASTIEAPEAPSSPSGVDPTPNDRARPRRRSALHRFGLAVLSAFAVFLLGPALLIGIISGPLAGRSQGLAFGQGCNAGVGGAATPKPTATNDAKGLVPAWLIPIYREAANRYALGPQGPAILASINRVETDFGSNMAVSRAGALGWMQFIPQTWAEWGIDADGGGADPSDPSDAIFTAAAYLKNAHAPADWHAAVFAYNNADWYVTEVLEGAKELRREVGAGESGTAGGCDASGGSLERMIAEADRIDALHLAYVFGGSHISGPTPADGPFDCSSAVSHLLQVGGFANPTMTTVGLVEWGQPGPGKQMTIYVKPFGADAHTFIEFRPGVTTADKRYWGTSRSNPDGGPGWIPAADFLPSYLTGFEQRHPPGL